LSHRSKSLNNSGRCSLSDVVEFMLDSEWAWAQKEMQVSHSLEVTDTRVHRSTAHTPQPPSTKIQKFLKLSSEGTPKKI
jgi:hypothetical protein